jgi:hypothetical protein
MERYALDDPMALVIMNDALLTNATLNETGLTKQAQIRSAGMTDSSFVMGCCAVVRRELLNICLPIPMDYKGHDTWIIKMAEGIYCKRVVTDVLQYYRRHDENVSQSIANRTIKATRRIVLWRNLRRAMVESDQTLSSTADQYRYFLEGVCSALTRASALQSVALAEFALSLERQLNVLEQRQVIRRKPRFMRLFAIIDLWVIGGYKQFSGFKSAVRDMIFL